jgi:glycosyltransferase involved in cell wall biosynthesis
MNTDERLDSRPLFSIITPVFNGQEFIRETIYSVLKAGIGYSYEYIVVDDGSTDLTHSILLEFSDSIKIIRQENCGEPQAVNTGLIKSSGALILILNADDPLFTSEIFAGVEEFFNTNDKVVAWYPDWRKIDHHGELIEEVFPLEFTFERMLGFGMCLPGPGTIFRADAAEKINGRSPTIRFASDFDFWLRLSQIGQIVHRRQVVAQWRKHDGSTSISSRGKAMGEERIKLIDSYVAINDINESLARTARASSRYFAAALGIFDKNVESRKLIIESIKVSKGYPKVAKLHVIVFALLHPISFYLVSLISKFSKSFKERIKDI